MKNFVIIVAVVMCLLSCDTQEEQLTPNHTGNEIVYQLYKGSEYNVSGVVTIKELVNGNSSVEVKLSGTQSGLSHPVHLHFDGIAGKGKIAAVLSPVEGGIGTSMTELRSFENSKPVTYADLVKMNACIKVHLSDSGLEKNIILAGGNIGSAQDKSNPYGRVIISVCSSN